MTSSSRQSFQKNRMTFHEFIAQGLIRKALRHHACVRSSEPSVVGVVGNRSLENELQIATATLVVPGWLENLKSPEGQQVTCIDCESATSKRKHYQANIETELHYALKHQHWVIAIAEDQEDLPELFLTVADIIVTLEPPSPRLLKAAFRYCLGSKLADAEARELATHDLNDVLLAATRGKSWRKVLEKTKTPTKTVSKVTLETLPGLGDAGRWGLDLANDLKAWQSGGLSWSEVDRGILVAGPPGTGKTTFAKALANSCGVELIATSLAQWQAAGHLGDLLKFMRASFAEARKQAPCILLIDEFDSAGNRATASGDNTQYFIEKINGLLECLDGVQSREGVVVVGLTNQPHLIDPAFLRPGRLEKTISIPLPDCMAREQILRWHLREDLAGERLQKLAARLEAYSGADIEKLVRDARRTARKEDRSLKISDLAECLPKRIPLHPDDLRRLAVHEAGHALLHLLVGEGDIVKLSIQSEISPERRLFALGALETRQKRPRFLTRQKHENHLVIDLAGLAAEQIVFGEFGDGGGGVHGSDLHQATLRALDLETSLGLGNSLVYLGAKGSARLRAQLANDKDLRRQVDRCLQSAFDQARELLSENRDALDALTDALLTHQTLSGRAVLEIVGGTSAKLKKAS
ncbi:MAG: AAA family ATPase [Pseudomonadota bacterium]